MNTVRDPAELLPGYATRWRALIFICISLMVVSLDNTILNVALPSISKTLSATASDLQWIVDAYVLVFAALLLTIGGLGDRYGRKKSLQIGLVLFGIGSLGAGLSPNTTTLIATRAFLGIAGARPFCPPHSRLSVRPFRQTSVHARLLCGQPCSGWV